MPPWIRRWRDWGIPDLFGSLRRPASPAAQALLISYEKAGLVVRHEPIPWNADRVRIEALLRLPVGGLRRKADFALRCGDQLATPDQFQTEEGGLCRVGFSLAPPRQAAVAELRWRDQTLGQAALPVLREEIFFDHLHLDQPTLSVQLGTQMAACGAYLGSQAKALLAGGVLSSPTSLAPLAGQELLVELTDLKTGKQQTTATRLGAAQLAQSQTLWQTLLPQRPKRAGDYQVRWEIAGHVLARQPLRVLGRRSPAPLLECRGSQFLRKSRGGEIELLRHFAGADDAEWLGVVFLLAAKEPGLALAAPLQVFLRDKQGRRDAVPLFHEEVLVTDGPTPVLPPLLSRKELQAASGFELVCQGKTLAHAAASPTPQAQFTSEGGYQPPAEEFPWSPAAESELLDRLKRLAAPLG